MKFNYGLDKKYTFFGLPSSQHFDHFGEIAIWHVLIPARVQVIFAVLMFVSHAAVGGWVTVVQRSRENPDNTISLGSLGGALSRPIHVPAPW